MEKINNKKGYLLFKVDGITFDKKFINNVDMYNIYMQFINFKRRVTVGHNVNVVFKGMTLFNDVA